VRRLRSEPGFYAGMATPRFPYGDGRASQRIVEAMRAMLSPRQPAALPIAA
jgi:UDP-N-acetylglucosamine 2-epimerase